jgi:signal transduction histidine kinase
VPACDGPWDLPVSLKESPGRDAGRFAVGTTKSQQSALRSSGRIEHRPVRSALGVPWALITATLSLAAGVVIALVTVPGVQATTPVSSATAVVEGIARGIIVAVPLAVGLYASRRPTSARFGRLLVGFSVIWFLALLSSAGSPVVSSVGRVASWFAEVALGYALLAFPTGRLETRVDRRLIAIAAGVVITLFVPTALLVAHYPTPSPWASCGAGCPHNAFMVVRHQPAFVNGVVVPVREILIVLLFVLVAARLAARIAAAHTLMRRTVVPVLVVSSLRMFVFAVALVARRVAPDSVLTHALMWALALLVPAIALAFLVGLMLWRTFVTAAIHHVLAQLRGTPGPQQVQNALAAGFEDPDLEIGYWLKDQGCWVTADGRPLATPAAGAGRFLTETHDKNQPSVAIVHDVALRDERAFVDVVGSLAAMAFASDRVAARTAGMLTELQASRSRISAAADDERRRIEQDLHDGAQQRLVALRVQLQLAAEQAGAENPAEAAHLRGLGDQVELAIDEIRSLAHGIYPAVLGYGGLGAGVRAAARRSTVPASVSTDGLTDYPQEIVTAVYLCCVEALQNVAKHARDATTVKIIITEADAELRFSVADDGVGFLPSQARVGAGMINMQDRLATIGGELTVHSQPGHGTSVNGRVPLSLTPHAPRGDRHAQPARSTHSTPRRPAHEK